MNALVSETNSFSTFFQWYIYMEKRIEVNDVLMNLFIFSFFVLCLIEWIKINVWRFVSIKHNLIYLRN